MLLAHGAERTRDAQRVIVLMLQHSLNCKADDKSKVRRKAARGGHAESCKLLQLMDPAVAGEGPTIAKADANQNAALLCSSESGYSSVFKLLMDPAVNSEQHCAKADATESTALRPAAGGGHAAMCKLLMHLYGSEGCEHAALCQSRCL